MTIKLRFPLLFRFLEVLVVFFTVMLVNLNSFNRMWQFPEVENYSSNEVYYLSFAVVTLVLMFFLLKENRLVSTYLAAWRENKALIFFLAYALLSLAWSVYPPATLYKLAFLFFSTLAGAYIAIRYQLRGVVDLISWIGAVFAILSIVIVVFIPELGIMQNEIFFGSWTGIFWHRNHTGNIFSFFSMLFLLQVFLGENSTWIRRTVYVILYLLSTAMVFGSRSATGVIVFLFLQLAAGLVVLWIKFNTKLKSWHYYLVGGSLIAGFLAFVTNTAFFFGLLGRSAQMTGRIPLWQDLIQRVYMQKPILGYGYGALWMQKRFRIEMQIRHGWLYQVFFADNGFFDILLNMGIIGLILFLLVYIPLGVRSLTKAVTSKSWLYFVPFLTFLYIFIGNLTYSFLLEVDQFVWMLLVIMVFAITAANSERIAQPYSQPNNTKLKDEV